MTIKRFSFTEACGARRLALSVLCGLALFTAACASKSGPDKDPAASPDARTAAYGLSINAPATWTVVSSVTPQAAGKEALDARRQAGERIMMIDLKGAASAKGLEPRLGVFLVNEQGTFMPREYAEKFTPEEFAAMSKDLLNQEREAAKKKKTKSNVLDLQVSRDTIDGKFTVQHRVMVAASNGSPVRLMNWDIYLPGGAGIAIKTVCDPDQPGLENELSNIAHSLRVR